MSVLVEGMKMPKNCVDCPLFESLYHFHGCHAKPESFKDRDMWNFAVGDRPTWCPLIDVPTPHGRLIDADALLQAIMKRLGIKSQEHFTPQKSFVCSMIDNSPIVIEEEEGDT